MSNRPALEASDVPPVTQLTGDGFRAGAATSRGHRRPFNEDAFGLTDRSCIVADGLGGHVAGRVASRLAVDALTAELAEPHVTDQDPTEAVGWIARIERAVHRTDADIRAAGVAAASHGMATTVVGIVPLATGAVVFHVGDSRCYRLQAGTLDLVTSDHTPDGGRGTTRRSGVVTRALGIGDEARPDVTVLAPVPSRLLLCTDGLSDQLPARAIGRVLAGVPDPRRAAARLIELTLAGAARDNVTAVVVDLESDMTRDGLPRAGITRGGSTRPVASTTMVRPWPRRALHE